MPLPTGVAAVFPYSPNWAGPVKQGVEYKTNILTSRDGTEQRIALRSKPRETLGYQILLEGQDAAEFEYRMWGLQPHVLMMPCWPRQRRLSVAAVLGTNQLVLDNPTQDGIRAGDEWILLAGDTYEVVTLDSVSADRKTLTLSDNLTLDWPKWSKTFPAWRVQCAAEVRSSKLTSGVVKAPLLFKRLVDANPIATREATADQMLGSLEVLTRRFNWNRPLEISHSWVAQFIDAEIGPFGYDTERDLPVRIFKGELLLDSRTEVDWWLAFFDRVHGRQTPFLMPTWQDDLLLQTPLGGSTFEVAGTHLGTYQAKNPIHTHLMVRKKDGSLAFFTIDNIIADSGLGITSITTTEAWDETYGPEECPFVCFMSTVRLVNDSLEIRWITDEVAKLILVVQTVEDVV
ncbi:hypothetical protein [Neptuniibacter sp.]|uniref:hypothetical protein n=1 Tax=Neptuniibacter sp. TaxID=1962643 RepID=UPI003B5A1142